MFNYTSAQYYSLLFILFFLHGFNLRLRWDEDIPFLEFISSLLFFWWGRNLTYARLPIPFYIRLFLKKKKLLLLSFFCFFQYFTGFLPIDLG